MLVIYGNELCSYCRRAKRLAEDYNIQYEWRDTDNDQVLNELKRMLPEAKTIPQIWWNGKHVGGYDDFKTEIGNTRGGFGEGKL
jgi:glutaredoxin 3